MNCVKCRHHESEHAKFKAEVNATWNWNWYTGISTIVQSWSAGPCQFEMPIKGGC